MNTKICLTDISFAFENNVSVRHSNVSIYISYNYGHIRVKVKVFKHHFQQYFNISCRSVLLVDETGVPGENLDLSHVTDKL